MSGFVIRIMLASYNEIGRIHSASICLEIVENWYNFFLRHLGEFRVNSSGVFCFGKILIVDKFYLSDINIFRLFISSCVGLRRFCLKRIAPLYLGYQISTYRVVHSISYQIFNFYGIRSDVPSFIFDINLCLLSFFLR